MLVQVAKHTQAWLNLLGVGGPSRDEMFNFMNVTNKLASSEEVIDGRPDHSELVRIARIIYMINRRPPIRYHVTGQCYENYHLSKYICMHADLKSDSGLVYHGPLLHAPPAASLPQFYGEFAYRYVGGAIFYAGYFDQGIPSGECRISIEGKKNCYGMMRSFREDNDIVLSFTRS